MNFFHFVEKSEKKTSISPPRSPLRKQHKEGKEVVKKSKPCIPDLCTSDLSNDSSREEELSVEARLNRAKERREKANRNLELSLNDKNEQAFQRAQENIAIKREKFRSKNRKVKKVNEKVVLLEKRRRKHAMHSIESRLNSALTRAEENIHKKKQGRARYLKRIDRAQNKRALAEIERRSTILGSLGHKTERASRNLQLRLEDLQDKARGEIERAHFVAKRLKAVRVLQKAVRVSFGFKESDQSELSMTAAVLRLQHFVSWKTKVVQNRLKRNNDLEFLTNILETMGLQHDDAPSPSFEALTVAITNVESLQSAKSLLGSFGPLLQKPGTIMKSETLSARTLLSVFLIVMQPDEVLGEKRDSEKCSKLLETAAKTLIASLVELSNVKLNEGSFDTISRIIQKVCSNILSYCTLFDKWKNADLDDLVEKMTKSAHQSWVAFFTSKNALLYIEEKYADQSGQFQHLLKYKSSKRGAGSHIKRIRAAMKRILGEEQSLAVMREAKQAAIAQIEREQLMVAIKANIDNIFYPSEDDSTQGEDSSTPLQSKSKEADGDIPDSISSNIHLVHQILLMDYEEMVDFSSHNSENLSHFGSTSDFMMYYQDLIGTSEMCSSNDFASGIKQQMVHLIHKMRNLVPNRKDLHQYFTEDQVDACKTTKDYFGLSLNLSKVMVASLESEHRSISTLEWYNTTREWQNNENVAIPYNFSCWRSYLVASMTFLIGKADLCQMDVVNFQIVRVAPIVKANGKEYEIQHFQENFGELLSLKSMKNFSATWNWIKRINENHSTEDSMTKLKEGFVDEILFTTEAIAIPEVLSLDLDHIYQTREKARLAVLSTSLILHSCKVTGVRVSNIVCDASSSEAKFYKEKLNKLLNSRLPAETMIQEVSECITSFAEITSGQTLDERKVETLQNVTKSVFNGTDPVFLLMDKRMKTIFKRACKFVVNTDGNLSESSIPMKTGRQENSQKVEKKLNGTKVQFINAIRFEARKLGFNIDEDILVQTTYEAYKVISHCLKLYGEELLCPMFRQLSAQDN